MTTYGEHAENAAQALNTLLGADSIPADGEAVEQLLHCREAVVDALRQRLFDLGHDSNHPPVDHLPAAPVAKLAGLGERLATLTDTIAFGLPNLPLDERRSPVDVLVPTSSDPTVAAWREAAIEMLAGSQALSSAHEQPWRTETGAGWWVMRDVAVALEAVVVLDDRLQEVGLLADHQHHETSMGIEEKRLILSQTARAATWHATSAIADQAAPRSARQAASSTVVEPVTLVAIPEDLAAAQRRLSRFLRPMLATESTYAGEPEISADGARQVATSQLYLCRAFAQAACRSPTTASHAAFFNARAEVLEDLAPQLSHLLDVADREPDRRRFWQQSELTTSVARMEDKGRPMDLTPAQMSELAQATHEVTHHLGKGLRRELLRSNCNLLDGHPRNMDGPVRVGRRSRLVATLADLVSMPAPSDPVARLSDPLQRAALKQTLDLTSSPTTVRTPPPFPAARGIIPAI